MLEIEFEERWSNIVLEGLQRKINEFTVASKEKGERV